jgi:hypothetical protein
MDRYKGPHSALTIALPCLLVVYLSTIIDIYREVMTSIMIGSYWVFSHNNSRMLRGSNRHYDNQLLGMYLAIIIATFRGHKTDIRM